MPWDVSEAVNHLQQHAQATSHGQCAQYVREAIGAGGINLVHTRYARDYGQSLSLAGFLRVPDVAPRAGDVIVIQPAPGHPDGHMAMYDGSEWISDFRQRYGFYPGQAYRRARPPYQIYRHN